MTADSVSACSVVSGPPQDWSGAWARTTAPGPSGEERSEVVSHFLSERGGVSFVYEPIIDTRRSPSGLHAVECLVRGPDGTPHEDPVHFFEFFRCRGHLAAVDAFCLEASLAEAASLPFRGSIVVNAEAVSVATPGFEARLLGLTRRAGIVPSRLVLDVRLGYDEAPTGRLAAGVVRTRAAGVRICFDETRASASPVRLLEVATPDFVKISRSTVRSLWRDPWTRECVEGTRRLGEELGFQVIAQGVESGRDLDAAKRCGISLVQGPLLGPPRRAEALTFQGELLEGERDSGGPGDELVETAWSNGKAGGPS